MSFGNSKPAVVFIMIKDEFYVQLIKTRRENYYYFNFKMLEKTALRPTQNSARARSFI